MGVYVFFGEEPYFISQAISTFFQKQPPCDVESLPSDVSLGDLFLNLSTPSLFSAFKCVHIKSPSFLLKTLEKKEISLFESVLQVASLEGISLILSHEGSLDQRKKQIQLLKKSTSFQEYHAFKPWEQDKLWGFMKEKASALGKTLSKEGMSLLELMIGPQLFVLDLEIEKLATYVGSRPLITDVDVKALAGSMHLDIFKLGDALKQKKLKEGLLCLQSLLKQGEDPIKLLGFLSSTYRFYLQLLSGSVSRLSDADLARLTGKNPFFIKRILGDLSLNYTLDQLKKALTVLADVDFEIKSGLSKPDIALIYGVSVVLS